MNHHTTLTMEVNLTTPTHPTLKAAMIIMPIAGKPQHLRKSYNLLLHPQTQL